MERIEKCLEGCDHDLALLLRAATTAALEAGGIIRDMYDNPHQIRLKGAIDLVTEADIASEKAILAILAQRFPGSNVLAEESNSNYENIPAGPVWIVDPLDGTTNFAHGFPYFCVSIAYSVDQVTQAGVVYCPILDELFSVWQGGGAWLNGHRINVSGSDSLIESLVATGFPYDIQGNLEQIMSQLHRVLPAVRDVRRAGAAALDLAYVACGRLDGFWETNLKPWDTAAGQLLVKEAGGCVTDFRSGRWTPYVPEVLATNGHIHALLAQLL
ncbi:MAG: inositol monophosphatase family protein [Thermodesulfobacteriota bacterium]